MMQPVTEQREFKTFHHEKHVKSMTFLEKSLDLNPIKKFMMEFI